MALDIHSCFQTGWSNLHPKPHQLQLLLKGWRYYCGYFNAMLMITIVIIAGGIEVIVTARRFFAAAVIAINNKTSIYSIFNKGFLHNAGTEFQP